MKKIKYRLYSLVTTMSLIRVQIGFIINYLKRIKISIGTYYKYE